MSTSSVIEIDALQQLADWWNKNKRIRFKTQKEFAESLGIGRSTLGDYLEKKRYPPLATRQKLYEVTGLEIFKLQSEPPSGTRPLPLPVAKRQVETGAEENIQGALIVKDVAASHQGKNKTFRIAVSGDVVLHQEECLLIDTLEFQRLRSIKQLGTASLVYPSATHTRFEHSIGTLFEAQRIVDHLCDPNKGSSVEKIELAHVDLIRLAALLHDVGHIPFGHTLEEETRVITEKHDDDERRNILLRDSKIGNLVTKNYSHETLDLLLKIMATKL